MIQCLSHVWTNVTVSQLTYPGVCQRKGEETKTKSKPTLSLEVYNFKFIKILLWTLINYCWQNDTHCNLHWTKLKFQDVICWHFLCVSRQNSWQLLILNLIRNYLKIFSEVASKNCSWLKFLKTREDDTFLWWRRLVQYWLGGGGSVGQCWVWWWPAPEVGMDTLCHGNVATGGGVVLVWLHITS